MFFSASSFQKILQSFIHQDLGAQHLSSEHSLYSLGNAYRELITLHIASSVIIWKAEHTIFKKIVKEDELGPK